VEDFDLAAGVLGLTWFGVWAYSRYQIARIPSTEVRQGTGAYPVTNAQPNHPLEISGMLPVSVPLGDFEATYETDFSREQLKTGPCQVLRDFGPKELWNTAPLQVKISVPAVREGEKYRAALFVDRFLPGGCNWHLSELHYRLHVQGYEDWIPNYRGILVTDEKHKAVLAPKGGPLYRGQVDVWCQKANNHAVTPYYPVRCGFFEDFLWKFTSKQIASVPSVERESHNFVVAFPDTTSIEYNFHDADALAASSPVGP
jgi:hypothetical protein